VHQHGACVAGNRAQDMGRSRGGLTSKVHAVVDANGLTPDPGRWLTLSRNWPTRSMKRTRQTTMFSV
jgi:hypothetical protein